jgi:O-antigen/teichoic acid export membrane protein
MSSLRTVQFWGVLTKAGTIASGIVQTAIVLRVLDPAGYGIVGIVSALGSLVGVSQHVGIVDATIREIAIAETPRRRAVVFWVSLWFRLAVTVPISAALALAASWIGTRVYVLPDIPHLVRLMSLILVLQGIQGVVGGAYTGKQAFGRLYLFQLIMTAVNIPLFALFTWMHGTRGFFEAVILSTSAFILLLSIFLRHALGGTLAHPRREEIRGVLADIMHTGVWTYVARILSVAWQRVPVLILGRWAAPDLVGLFSAALAFGGKLVLLASALGEVNLSFLSSTYVKGRDAFRTLAERTLTDVGAVVLLGGGLLALFPDVLLPVLAGSAYASAARVVTLTTWAFAAFSYFDIAANTIFVPARRAQYRAFGFGALLGGTLLAMVLLRAQPLNAAAWGMLGGSVLGLAAGELMARVRMSLTLFPPRLLVLLVPGTVLVLTAAFQPPFHVRVLLFLACAAAIFWAVYPSLFRRKATSVPVPPAQPEP